MKPKVRKGNGVAPTRGPRIAPLFHYCPTGVGLDWGLAGKEFTG